MNVTRKRESNSYLIDWIIRVGDVLLINLFFLAVYYIFRNYEITSNIYHREQITASLTINLCYFFVSSFIRFQISSNVIYLDKIVQKSTVFIAIYSILLTAGFSIFQVVPSIPIIPWIIGFLALGTLYIIWHIAFRILLKIYRRKGYNYRQVIIAGGGINGVEIHETLLCSDFGYKIMGFFDDDPEKTGVLPNYLGKISEIKDYIKKEKVDEIFCTLPGIEEETIADLILFSEKNMIRFQYIPEFHRYIKRRFTFYFLETTPVLSLRNEPLQHFSNRFVKRSFDFIVSGILLVTIFPVILLVFGIAIKLSSRGPIFFVQKRTGIKGQEFNCYKFRSMKPNKEADKLQAVANDPRLTKVGAFMRKTNIDELPQLLNVFRNEMSLVGPRPHMLKHTDEYSALIDKFMVRHLVKPGITGWAQVTGFRGETKTVNAMEERVKRDVWYLENWTFFLDLKILFLTVFNMFRGDKKAF
ncbi:MAG: undecaprenyl-phosphate glucose phosphotransferase [Prevotella sp.]|jgi:putative colanic acid biosynthesis UDP-glucose lipid carrier transferase|nr:undecaprenyl-phosphate glucose phosphotransferase [Prevotella sp.]